MIAHSPLQTTEADRLTRTQRALPRIAQCVAICALVCFVSLGCTSMPENTQCHTVAIECALICALSRLAAAPPFKPDNTHTAAEQTHRFAF